MATKWRPAEAFPPGDFLREEIEERGWTQDDLAAIMGMGYGTVNGIIGGKRSLTTGTANALAAALGTTAQFWLNLDSAYQLWRSETDESDVVARRARLYTIAPIKDMVRRGWIEPSDDIDRLEDQVISFFEMDNLDKTPTFAHAARKSTSYDQVTNSQLAWLFRASHLSRYVHADKYERRRLSLSLEQLRPLMYSPQEIRQVPRVLGEAGIRLVIVEHLPRTKIDGATFWVEDSPVIAISIRYDRIDNFWFTLLHEMGHVAQGNSSIDVDIGAVEEDLNDESEHKANLFAAEQAISQTHLDSLIERVGPLYSTDRIQGFAELHGVHPGIVVGQLHHRHEIMFSNFRRLLVPIRSYITQSAVVDGWGMTFPTSTSSRS